MHAHHTIPKPTQVRHYTESLVFLTISHVQKWKPTTSQPLGRPSSGHVYTGPVRAVYIIIYMRKTNIRKRVRDKSACASLQSLSFAKRCQHLSLRIKIASTRKVHVQCRLCGISMKKFCANFILQVFALVFFNARVGFILSCKFSLFLMRNFY